MYFCIITSNYCEFIKYRKLIIGTKTINGKKTQPNPTKRGGNNILGILRKSTKVKPGNEDSFSPAIVKNNKNSEVHENYGSNSKEQTTTKEVLSVNTSWIREWMMLEVSQSNTGACLNSALFSLENISLDSSTTALSMGDQATPMPSFKNNLSGGSMNNNISSFFLSFTLDLKALEVDMLIKLKSLESYCKCIAQLLNDQGVTSGIIDFPMDVIEDNGFQLVKLLEIFGSQINLSFIKLDSLIDKSLMAEFNYKTPRTKGGKLKEPENCSFMDSKLNEVSKKLSKHDGNLK